jgi:hypothetical protein
MFETILIIAALAIIVKIKSDRSEAWEAECRKMEADQKARAEEFYNRKK